MFDIKNIPKISFKSRKKEKVGLPPGTLIYTGEKKQVKPKITIIDYNSEEFEHQTYEDISFSLSDYKGDKIRWINLTGLSNVNFIEKIGAEFNIHPLILEDILNTNQGPKFEEYPNYVFIIMDRLLLDEEKKIFDNEQVSFILGKNFVLSFVEQETDIFNPVIERLKTQKGRIRSMKADFLLYALIDLIIDYYFLTVEVLGEELEGVEDLLIGQPETNTLQKIYELKRKIIEMRKISWPLREIISKLQRGTTKLISEDLQIYLRDLFDHIFRINDLLENYREIIFGMLDIYLSSVSNKMNDIMKVLTIISTVFIPLSFLASFYGMNFYFMPELANPVSYPILITIMVMISLIMLYFFRRKKWI